MIEHEITSNQIYFHDNYPESKVTLLQKKMILINHIQVILMLIPSSVTVEFV